MSVTIPSLPACATNSPFMTLGTGTAPALNYNLPQKTCFTTYSSIPIPVNPAWFSSAASEVPSLLTFDQAKEMILELVIYPNQAIPSVLIMISSTNLATLKDYYAQALLQNSVANIIDFIANHAYDTTYGPSVDHTALLNNFINYLANLAINTQKAAVALAKFGNYSSDIYLFDRPYSPVPTLFIVEEYETCSYLGDYGAGETVNTFTLLPGEQTTISIQTFQSTTGEFNYSDNVLDSLSDSSSTNFQAEMDNQKQSANTFSAGGGFNAGLTASIAIPEVGSVGGGFGVNVSAGTVRADNSASLSKILENHVNSSNSNRTVNVNSTTTQTNTTASEQDIQRELVNPNLSRVLNFVFRQLLQEYVCITTLGGIKVGFTNGHPESTVIVGIEQLDTLLSQFITSDHQADVKQMIWNEYHTIDDYTGTSKTFLKEVTDTDWDGTTEINYYTHAVALPGNTDTTLVNTYTYDSLAGSLPITVDGPILNVTLQTLRTASVIADALMGQGEALDCFNAHVQDAKTQALYIQNNQAQLDQARVQLALDTLTAITDPVQRAQQYAAIFNPQVQNIID